jgi:hypothetical protein
LFGTPDVRPSTDSCHRVVNNREKIGNKLSLRLATDPMQRNGDVKASKYGRYQVIGARH